MVAQQTRTLLRAQRPDHGRVLRRERRRVQAREAANVGQRGRTLGGAWTIPHVRPAPRRNAGGVRAGLARANAERREAGPFDVCLQLFRRAEAHCAGEEVMSLPAGSNLGSYAVIAPLGAGGMGEVYRARDTRLK